jgi:hypothetical protein
VAAGWELFAPKMFEELIEGSSIYRLPIRSALPACVWQKQIPTSCQRSSVRTPAFWVPVWCRLAWIQSHRRLTSQALASTNSFKPNLSSRLRRG